MPHFLEQFKFCFVQYVLGMWLTASLTLLQHIDGINLFGLISIASLLYCAPLAILMEGSVWSGAYNTALANVGKNELFKQMAIAGIFYHLYNQVSCQLSVPGFP